MIEEWQYVLNSEMWELEEVEHGIFPPLLLSYFDLSSELKTCFLYCAIFPKDYKIEKERLIKLWIAHGYFKPKQNKDMELVGEKYFGKLAMCSFFQDFERDADENIKWCKMHDMVPDLAQYLSNNECYRAEVDDKEGFLLSSKYIKTPDIMMMVLNGEALFSISLFDESRLRSLLFDGGNWSLDELFDHYTSLRALDLSDMSINDVPSGINKSIHLRYLDISRNRGIKEIPEVMCDLYYLQTLVISSCRNLNKLPEGIGKLVNLWHLINGWSFDECRYMPKGISKLRTLEKQVVSGDKKTCKFEYLRNFNHLSGFLHIKCCGVNVGEINEAELKNKTKFIWFWLELSSDVSNEEALEDFQPPPNLGELTLEGYSGDNCLSFYWLMSLTKLKTLTLNNWSGSESLCLGKLPCLESLYIVELMSLKRLGDEFLGMGSDNIMSSSSSSSSSAVAFPKLQFLEFEFLEKWEEWDSGCYGRRGAKDIKIMPYLHSLGIRFCPKLRTLPDYLLQSTTLEEFGMYNCSILERSYRDEEVKNWVSGSGMPRIRIYENSKTSSPSVSDN